MEFIHFWWMSVWESLYTSWDSIGGVDLTTTVFGGAMLFFAKKCSWWKKWTFKAEHPVWSETWRLLVLFVALFVVTLVLYAPFRQFEQEHQFRLVAEDKARNAALRADASDKKTAEIEQVNKQLVADSIEHFDELSSNDSKERSQEDQDFKSSVLKALLTPNPTDSLATSIAQTPIPPLPVLSAPDFDKAAQDLQARMTQADAQNIEERKKGNAQATAMAAYCSSQFDYIIRTFISYLQSFASSHGDQVKSTYNGLSPVSFAPDTPGGGVASIFLKANKKWTFRIGVSTVMVDQLDIFSNTIRADIQMTPNAPSGNSFSLYLSVDDKPIPTIKCTDKDFRSNVNTVLMDIIAAENEQNPISPTSSTPDK